MSAEKTTKNPLSSRSDVAALLLRLLRGLDQQFNEGDTGITLGETCAHYGPDIARMEGLSRALWGLFPLMAGGDTPPEAEKYLTAIRHGTDPQHPGYWGETGPYDQRLVEMAAYGLGLALLQEKLTARFSERELNNLYQWLRQAGDAEMPDSNWNYFAILVELGFKRAGLPWRRDILETRFARMEAYYLGNGWYADGPGRPKDYYISMAFHFYGLVYATLMAEDDAERAATLRERAHRFAADFIWFSAADGASIPFGRSLTYRFAMVAFWSAVAFAGLDVFTPGVVKGIVLRHLRWWMDKPVLDRDDILTLGYACPNLAMCEDYNSPGSPYWALKVFLVLAMAEESPFWQAREAPLPLQDGIRAIPEASQLLAHSEHSRHAWLLTAGQVELNNYVNTEAKYTKFAYSSHFGFTIERGRYGIKHAACDSMLLLCENDGYYRGRRECDEVVTAPDHIFSRWSPWRDVQIATWLIPYGPWHLRVHHIRSDRDLHSVEGGFATLWQAQTTRVIASAHRCAIEATFGASVIVDLAPAGARQAEHVITPPNSSVMFAECAAIPCLTGAVAAGESWLCSAVAGVVGAPDALADAPEITLEADALRLRAPDGTTRRFPLYNNK
ncbi:DUF2264 domain-containing protein [Cronobacter malonaticus]|uniref:DUF2264 domain-containing protein n=1 Tax=Cronobacter malonaticus TaxID=413503 RepID=UPI001A1C4FFE|nr:DUF2264 domain-containing protein [Cronobacter malonaticus]MDI6458824.1 DUF2264 domain-containing protein [Cronobacter malonaticus]HAU5429940.1 DUF2264 domain-containing protein [Cronobacter malonaticus]